MTDLKSKLEIAEAEIARLHNIIAVQQKQIERLLDARDAETLMQNELWAVLNAVRVAAKFGNTTGIVELLPRINEVLEKGKG